MCSRAYQQGDDSSLLYEQTKAYAKGRSAEQILIVPQNAEEGDGTDTLLKRVQTYIRNHYTERLTLADIAEAVHVSSSYLSRFYKLKAGENLFDTINSLRVEKAKELLLRGDKKIYEIAALTGFEDTAYFFQRCLRNMQDVRQRNTSSPEEEIYEKRNVGFYCFL